MSHDYGKNALYWQIQLGKQGHYKERTRCPSVEIKRASSSCATAPCDRNLVSVALRCQMTNATISGHLRRMWKSLASAQHCCLNSQAWNECDITRTNREYTVIFFLKRIPGASWPLSSFERNILSKICDDSCQNVQLILRSSARFELTCGTVYATHEFLHLNSSHPLSSPICSSLHVRGLLPEVCCGMCYAEGSGWSTLSIPGSCLSLWLCGYNCTVPLG